MLFDSFYFLKADARCAGTCCNLYIIYIYIYICIILYYRHTVAGNVFIKHTGSYNILIQSTWRLGGTSHGMDGAKAALDGTDDEWGSNFVWSQIGILQEIYQRNALLKILEGFSL